ncbi:MAG: DUF3786 domain-containing protein [Candidatus Bathyarchaeales archaeon]
MQLGQDVKARFASLIDNVLRADASLVSKSANGRFLDGNQKGLEASVLGINYKAVTADGDVEVHVEDPLNREEDSSRLFVYLLNAIERVSEGKSANNKGSLTSLTQLQGGQTAKLYEKRIVTFLAAEMDEATLEEVEVAAKKIGGSMVVHSNATWSFEVTPFNSVRIRAAYWQGEEGIPSGATLLVGEEIKDAGVPIEELLTIMEMTINRFVLFYRKETDKKPKLFHSLYF